MAITYTLEDKVALVTGGASGIGEATVRLLLEAGTTVAVLDTHPSPTTDHPNLHWFTCDIAEIDQVNSVYKDITDQFERVDILVNNVGVWIPGGDILEMSEEDMEHMDAVNVIGPRHLTRLVMNDMKSSRSGGSIVFVSSTQAFVIDGSPTIYNVEKNTILGMMKTFAVAGGPYNIRVNAVSPGAIATEGMGAAEAVGKERILAGNHKTPIGRRGYAAEVAQEIVHLCFATYTTGDNRVVDGGFSKVALPESLNPDDAAISNGPDATFLREN